MVATGSRRQHQQLHYVLTNAPRLCSMSPPAALMRDCASSEFADHTLLTTINTLVHAMIAPTGLSQSTCSLYRLKRWQT
jgi:hypothetical protein